MQNQDKIPRNVVELLRIQRDLGVALNSTTSLAEALRAILDALFRTDEIDAAGVSIFAESTDEIALNSSKGFPQRLTDAIHKALIEDPITQHAREGNPIYAHFEKISSPLSVEGVAEKFKALGIIPFVFLEKTFGAIVIASRINDHFSIESRYTFETIATRVASIINRLRGEETLKKTNHILGELNNRLSMSEERYRTVVEDQTDLISRFKPDGIITFVNGSYCRYFEMTRDELIGHSFIPTIHTEDRDRTNLHIRSLSSKRPVATIEHRIILPNGSVRWIEWTDRAITTDDGSVVEYQSVGRDVTERKNLEERLQYMSMHDALTKLYNRAFFDEQMKRLADARYLPLSVIVADLNALKIVNDALGHQTGDLLLHAAAAVLRTCFRGSDIVARIGGDEFAILLPNTNMESLLQTVDRIKKAVQDNRQKNPDVPLSLALGYAVRARKSTTMEEVFAEADDLMYREKEDQRDFTRGLVLTSLLREIERIDPYRAAHMPRVRDYAMALAPFAKLGEKDIPLLQLASRYHDVGMIGIDRKYLDDLPLLSNEEIEAVRRHVDIGARIAEAHPFLHDISQVIQHHHERWDGGGYPSGLAGEDIPVLSRIITICDAFDAMTMHSTFKPRRSRDDALAEIERLSGTQFDPVLGPLFVRLIKGSSVVV